jgi:hypothetical protein
LTKTFTITTPSTFKATVGNDFVVGDMSLRLSSVQVNHTDSFVGEHMRNYEVLQATLEPGKNYFHYYHHYYDTIILVLSSSLISLLIYD